jgi:hypothetical protein
MKTADEKIYSRTCDRSLEQIGILCSTKMVASLIDRRVGFLEHAQLQLAVGSWQLASTCA